MTDLSGQYLGRYYLTERLGEGGMAIVYKAYDTRLERDVAIKIIRSGAFPSDDLEQILKRFEREAKSLAKLSHPNIVKVYDYGEHEGSPYLVMEYLPGGTLKKTLGKPVPWQEAVRLILPVARGIAYAHQNGILHRDIKPANILITASGDPMLSDFGIAKLFEGDQATALTGSGMAIGTPEYMAPEQWAGTTTPQSDLYSLGIVLYEMVAGRKPYVADTPGAILIKQVTEPLPGPRKFVAEIPEALEHVLVKALAREPADRYKDIHAFVHALENLHVSAPVIPPAEPKPVEATYQVPSPKADDVVPTEIVTKVNHEPVVGKVEETLPAKTRSPIKFARIGIVILIGGVVVILAVWLGLPLIGKLFSPVQDATKVETKTGVAPTSALITSSEALSTVLPLTETPVANVTPSVETPVAAIMKIGSLYVREKDDMEIVYVPAGEFYMGSSCHEPGCLFKQGGHVDATEAYWIDKTEVTNAMYGECVLANGCTPLSKASLGTINNYFGNSNYDNYPVVNVTYQQAVSYCQWVGGHLPIAKEWEKAARGTDGRGFPWGIELQGYEANFCDVNCDDPIIRDNSANDGYRYTSPVDSFSQYASPYGVLNMAGNVSEFVEEQDARGGSWNSVERGLWTFMSGLGDKPPSDTVGIRCAFPVDTTASQPTVAQTPTPEPVTNASPTQITDDKGVEMMLVPAGEFTMGSNADDALKECEKLQSGCKREWFLDEQPEHLVYLDAYYIDKYEVTNTLYKVCVDAGICLQPSDVNKYNNPQYAQHPVVYVDWYKAKAYCEWRGAHLPTEAEWEKAAKGTGRRTYPWGEGVSCEFANYTGCIGETTKVGNYPMGISPYGVYDLAGNVSELVADWYDAYTGGDPNASDDFGQTYRVMRGGPWKYAERLLRVSQRLRVGPDHGDDLIGFRCAKPAP